MKLIGIKTKTSSLVDFILAGAIKSVEEPMLAQIVGDGTLVSGAVKGVIAGLIDGKGGKLGNAAAMAFGVDAGEDIARSLLGMVGGAGIVLPGLGGAQQDGGDW